jgi:hypothetical protein
MKNLISRSFPKLATRFLGFAALTAAIALPFTAESAEFVVYSVYKAIDLGNPGEVPQKDFYVNMGSANGLHDGSTLEVIRKVATYDLLSEKLYKDISFPIARLKVIHVEPNASVARLEQLLPADKTPAIANRAVMVGDAVQITNSKSE